MMKLSGAHQARLAAIAAALALGCGSGSPTGAPDGGDAGQPCAADRDCAPPALVCYGGGVCGAGCATTGCPSGERCDGRSGRCAIGLADAGSDSCGSDSECLPPFKICAGASGCVEGCLSTGCGDGQACDGQTGRCKPPGAGDAGAADAGPADGGSSDAGQPHDGGPALDGGSSCQFDSDCLSPFYVCGSSGQCVASCLLAGCASGLSCDSTSGHCVAADAGPGDAGPHDGGSHDGGSHDGGPSDGGVAFAGCGYCGACEFDAECAPGEICNGGGCTVSCASFQDCIAKGAIAQCGPVAGRDGGWCLPLAGICGGLGGVDTSCLTPSGINPACAPPNLPSPAWGANAPLLAADAGQTWAANGAIAVQDQQARALFESADPSSSAIVFASWQPKSGSWQLGGGPTPLSGLQSEPSLTFSSWTDGSGARRRLHAAWVGHSVDSSTGAPRNYQLEAAWSDDLGGSWTSAVAYVSPDATAAGALERPSLAAGPGGALAIAFSQRDSTGGQHVYALVSLDHGGHWTAGQLVATGAAGALQGQPAVLFDPSDAQGKKLLVAWLEVGSPRAADAKNAVLVASSSDDGAHWTSPALASAGGERVLDDAPSIALDADARTVFVGYSAGPASADATASLFWDARVAALDVTAAPARLYSTSVNDDQGGCFKHFHTQVAVSAAGRLVAGFLDDRTEATEPSGRRVGRGGAWVAGSSDGARSFSPNQLVSSASFPFNAGAPASSARSYLGRSGSLAIDGAQAYFLWSDGRSGAIAPVLAAGSIP